LHTTNGDEHMTQEALKLALDFVETVHVGEWVGSIERQLEVITAVKKALAQTQEPVAQPASEEDMKIYKTIAANYHKDLSTPPQRTWVGLTDEEIAQGWKESWVTEQAWQSAVWWAEEKLKEKNT
jgi:hypothetical protein